MKTNQTKKTFTEKETSDLLADYACCTAQLRISKRILNLKRMPETLRLLHELEGQLDVLEVKQ